MVEHYFSENPQSPLRISPITVKLRGNEIKLFTGSSVFSVGQVDSGTWLLIEKANIEDGWRVLDLGCAYGAVGIAIAKAFPRCEVVMTDINKRATFLARKGVKENNIDALVLQGEVFEKVTGKFNTILLNPPMNAGRQLCLKMIKESKDFLLPEGTLQIVSKHNKGGEYLSKYMEKIFGNVGTIAKKSGYRIYVSVLAD